MGFEAQYTCEVVGKLGATLPLAGTENHCTWPAEPGEEGRIGNTCSSDHMRALNSW